MTLRNIADCALNTLVELRLEDRNTAINGLDQLRRKVANHVPDHNRADAWLAVCAIADALEKRPAAPGIAALWEDAIVKMTAWRDAL
jgi:hypothetical protein